MFLFVQEKGIIENYFVINCYSPVSLYWRLFLYVYLGILQTTAAVLAFKTRYVKIPVLNDSKSLSASVFITSVLAVGLVIVTVSLRSYSSIRAFYYYGGVMLSTGVFVFLVFVPKVYSVHVLANNCKYALHIGMCAVEGTILKNFL